MTWFATCRKSAVIAVFATAGGPVLAAPQLLARPTPGVVARGQTVQVEVLLADGDARLYGVLDAPGASVVPDGDGHWRLTWTPRDESPLRLTAALPTGETVSTEVPVYGGESGLRWPTGATGIAGGGEPVALLLEGTLSGDVSQLRVAAGMGSIASVIATEDGTRVTYVPPLDPFPRAVPLLLVDTAYPQNDPSLGVLTLRAKTTVPVQTEPGTQVSVELGGRTLPTVVADASGVALVPLVVRPGDETARLTLTDSAGNTNTSTIRLGGDPRPLLVGVAVPGQPNARSPEIIVAAVRAGNRGWTGEAPDCRTRQGAAVPLVPLSPGLWRGAVPAEVADAARVDCDLGLDARTTILLDVPQPVPDRLAVRVSPPELDAQSPVATVRAWVEDPLGERIVGIPPSVVASWGTLTPEADWHQPGVFVAQYDGVAAIAHGQDRLVAQWRLPAGVGSEHDIELSWRVDGAGGTVAARSLDATGHPLPPDSLRLSWGGQELVTQMGEYGWCTAEVPPSQESVWLYVSTNAQGIGRGAFVTPGMAEGRDWTGPDLVFGQSLPILVGPVRQVALSVEPPVLVTAEGRTARIVLSLADQDGSPVTDVPVELSASRGFVSEPRRRVDGSIEATYTPEREGDAGPVEILVGSPDGRFPSTATELTLVPKAAGRAPGLHVGWLVGPDGVSSPWASLDGNLRLDAFPNDLRLRLSAGVYSVRASAREPNTGEALSVGADFVPLGVGLLGQQAHGRLLTWVGAAALVVPYRVSVSLDGSRALRGLALAPPGGHVFVGTGLKTRTGQLDLQLGYLVVSTAPGDGGWQGQVGGFLSTLGYRHGF